VELDGNKLVRAVTQEIYGHCIMEFDAPRNKFTRQHFWLTFRRRPCL